IRSMRSSLTLRLRACCNFLFAPRRTQIFGPKRVYEAGVGVKRDFEYTSSRLPGPLNRDRQRDVSPLTYCGLELALQSWQSLIHPNYRFWFCFATAGGTDNPPPLG